MTSQISMRRAPRGTLPGPPRGATARLLRDLFTDRLTLLSAAAEEYGDAVRITIGPKSLYLFNHPEHAKHILADNNANYRKGIGLAEARRALGDGLLTSDGELWRKQRAAIQPAFQHKRIAEQAAVVAEEAAALVARLREHRGGEPVDVLGEMTRLTLGVLGRALLDTEIASFGSIRESFEAVQDQAMFEAVTLGWVPAWLPLPRQRRFRRARHQLRRIAEELVAERRTRPGTGDDDLLSRLVAAAGAEGDPRLGAQRARDELITLLLAGHETTASTLSWSFTLLDRHPEVRERLRQEALEVLGDRLPAYDDLHRLTYTTQVVQEVMRLYPPVWLLPRLAREADEIGGYRVPPGADVVVCTYTLHRHPAFWDLPERFDPERFDPARAADRPRYAYLPFGAGPRFCVGNSLGMLEAVFVLAVVTRDLRLSTLPGYRAVPEPMLSLRVRDGLPMTVRPAG
ncbi:cytochrome P450 [Amycolatopsis anabasis]|uniref:cytochrome P450 n=1 Tax=Amycolatopsis anabasis TaxID=1840409 RepID=UPI001FE691C0|nr:cytochrome P450 [Amycolatopsis anabasis]